jgi:hypothetical protein
MSWFKKLFGPRAASPAPVTTSDLDVAPSPSPEIEFANEIEIEARLRAAYADQLPFRYGVNLAFEDGGPDPLRAIEVFWSDAGPHWHYLGYGIEDVGLILSFRLGAQPGDRGTDPAAFLGAIAYQAPTWPLAMLNMLARRVRRTGRRFGPGHWWQGPPGVLRPHAGFEHLAFALDPTVGETAAVQCVQAVAITPAVAEAMRADEVAGHGALALAELRAADPLLITDLARFP